MTMLERLNAMAAKLDAVLQPERCDEITEQHPTPYRITGEWGKLPIGDISQMARNSVDILFLHSDRIQIDRFEVHA